MKFEWLAQEQVTPGLGLVFGGRMADVVSRTYRRRAVEVERLAKTAISDDHRRELLAIAAKWRQLADERDEFWKRRIGGDEVSAR